MLHRLIALIGFLLLTGSIYSQEQLTIEQAIEIALKNNYDIQIARNDADIARIANNIGNAGMLPRLNATLSDNYTVTNINQELTTGTKINQTGATGNTLSVGVNFSWTLFDGLKMFATKGKLNRLEQIGQLNVRDTLQIMIAQVMNAYYDVVSSRQQLRSIQEAIALYEAASKQAELQFKVGSTSKVAYLQAMVDLNANRSAALTQQKLIEQKKAQLNLLLSRAAETDFTSTDSIPFNENPELMPASELDSKNYQVLVAAKNLEVARLIRKETFSQILPTFTIGAGNSTTGYNFVRTENSAGFSLYNQNYGPGIGFTLAVPLFNGLTYLHQIKVAKISIQNSEYKLQKVSLQTKINYYKALKDFEAAKQILKLENETIVFAKENSDIALERFRVAQSTAVELRQAQQSYVDAMTRLVTARYNAKTAETELMRIQGILVK